MSTAAGTLLRTAGGRALFLKRAKGAYAGSWALPAGKIEDGETPEQAARRETEEETGHLGNDPLVQIDQGDFVTFREDVEEFEPRLNDEHTEHVWAPMESPPEPLHPGVAAMLKKLNSPDGRALDAALDRREYDANSWYEVSDNPLSVVGVYQYRESSIVKGGDPNKMVGVFRPPEELSSPECIASFKLLPWTDDHPGELLGPKEQGLVPADEKGVRGVIGEKVYFMGGTLYGNIKVFSEALARKIASGKRELSCGYHCQFVAQTGVYNGEAYQYVQRNIRGNHVASVDKGRMGSDVRVLDAADCCLTFALDLKEVPAMPEKRKDEVDGTVDAETQKFITTHVGDSFNSLVGELEKKGYSKEYATKIAGKVANEKRGDSTDNATDAGNKVADKSEVKDPEGKAEGSAEDKKAKDAMDAKRSARDSVRSARDAKRSKDEMSSEEEEAEDAAECAEDSEEEKEDEKEDSNEARDRRSARDRRAGARDARKGARDRAKDRAKDARKGMDAAEVAALVRAENAKVIPAMRKEAALKHKLYDRLLPITGVFDHSEMTHEQMAAYGLKNLSLPESDDPVNSLEYALLARAQVQVTPSPGRSAQDSGDEPAWFASITKSA